MADGLSVCVKGLCLPTAHAKPGEETPFAVANRVQSVNGCEPSRRATGLPTCRSRSGVTVPVGLKGVLAPLRGETHLVPKNDDWKQAHLAMRWSGSASAPGCTAIDCRHSVMIEPHELARQSPARHADSAAQDLKGNALHALLGAEGMLLAGAAQTGAINAG